MSIVVLFVFSDTVDMNRPTKAFCSNEDDMREHLCIIAVGQVRHTLLHRHRIACPNPSTDACGCLVTRWLPQYAYGIVTIGQFGVGLVNFSQVRVLPRLSYVRHCWCQPRCVAAHACVADRHRGVRSVRPNPRLVRLGCCSDHECRLHSGTPPHTVLEWHTTCTTCSEPCHPCYACCCYAPPTMHTNGTDQSLAGRARLVPSLQFAQIGLGLVRVHQAMIGWQILWVCRRVNDKQPPAFVSCCFGPNANPDCKKRARRRHRGW